MAARPVRALALLAFVLLPAVVSAQVGAGAPVDPLGLTQLKDFGAWRSSSNNADPDSNDDSKRPIPGETVVARRPAGARASSRTSGSRSRPTSTAGRACCGCASTTTAARAERGRPARRLLRASATASSGRSTRCSSATAPSGRSRNSYWPMPFERSCRITITNEGPSARVEPLLPRGLAKLPALPPGTAYFHARYRQALPAAARHPYEVLSVQGRGHYVGTVLSVVQNEPGWFGEGDERFYVDGETAPTHRGHRHRGLLQRRLEPARGRGAVHRRAGGRGHRSRRAHDRVPLARRRPDPLHPVAPVRHRARRLDLQRRRHGAVGVRGTRPTCSAASPSGTRHGIARDQPPSAVRRGAAAARQRAGRSKSRTASPTSGPRAAPCRSRRRCSGRRTCSSSRRRGRARRSHVPFDVGRSGAVRAGGAGWRTAPTTASTTCCSTASRSRGRTGSSTSRARTPAARAASTGTSPRPTSPRTTCSAG